MTADRDVDLQLRAWLEESSDPSAPDDLLDRGLARVGTTRQRPGWLVRDRGRSRRAAGRPAAVAHGDRLLAVVAAVIVVAVGFGLFLRPSPAMIAEPSSSPSPSPSPLSSSAPSASAPPSGSMEPRPSSSVRPPTPSPVPTPSAPLAPGFAWTGSMSDTTDGPLRETATLLADGRVLVAGGCTTAVELYDPASGSFEPTGSLSAIRGGMTATRLTDGRVLITGGYNCGPGGQEAIWASAELYDPATGTFSATGSMRSPREFHTATSLADGRVLIAGGINLGSGAASPGVTLAAYRTADTANALATAELYDPATGTFTSTGSMEVGRDQFTATLLADGRVLVVGGGGEGYASRASAELFDPTAGTFARTGSMRVGRWLHTATRLGDGRVLVTGGRSPDDAVYASADVFDPGTGTWGRTGSMETGRQQHTATLLADGRVLIAGGYEQVDSRTAGQSLSSTEIYDPGAGTFIDGGSMGEPRASHTATTLDDGRVLIAGGFDIGDRGAAGVTSAVLFDP